MAIYIHCPHCHKPLTEVLQECTHCGGELPVGVLYALSLALGKSPMPPPMLSPAHLPAHLTQAVPPAPPPVTPPVLTTAAHSRLRPWLAAALSLFCGLGQLYNGQVIKGAVLMVLGAVAVLSSTWLLGKLLLPLIWSYALVDAYVVARRRLPPASPRLQHSPYRH
jgi:TM2 domain-containing membrane protein YozV